MERIEGESQRLASSFQQEREELTKKMVKMEAEAKREQERIQGEYREQLAELQRQRELDRNQSEARQAALSRQIGELNQLLSQRPRKKKGLFKRVAREIARPFR